MDCPLLFHRLKTYLWILVQLQVYVVHQFDSRFELDLLIVEELAREI